MEEQFFPKSNHLKQALEGSRRSHMVFSQVSITDTAHLIPKGRRLGLLTQRQGCYAKSLQVGREPKHTLVCGKVTSGPLSCMRMLYAAPYFL